MKMFIYTAISQELAVNVYCKKRKISSQKKFVLL